MKTSIHRALRSRWGVFMGLLMLLTSQAAFGQTLGNPPQVDSDAPWPTLGGNVRHSGQSTFEGPGRSWALEGLEYTSMAPSIDADGTIYVTAGPYKDESLYALSPKTGTVQWTFTPGDFDPGSKQPVIGKDGTVYVGGEKSGDGGVLYAVDSSTGEMKWENPALFPLDVQGAPALAENSTIYISTDDYNATGAVYAIDAANGDTLWSVTIDDATSPTIAPDGTVYVSANSGKIYAIDPTTQSATPLVQSGSDQFGPPALGADGTIYATSRNGISAFDPENGELLWNKSISYYGIAPPVLGPDETIYVSAGGEGGGALFAYDPDGTQKWSIPGNMIGSAVSSDNVVYTVVKDFSGPDQLLTISPSDGSVRTATNVNPDLSSSPILMQDGTAIISTNDGVVSLPTARVEVQPASLNFDSLKVGERDQLKATIQNTGEIDLDLRDVRISGRQADAFSIASGGGPGTITPDTMRAVIVAFAPTSTGTKSASLVIDSNAGQQTVALSGATRAPSLRVAPTALDFGSMPLDSAPTDTVTLSNTGNADLQLRQIALGGDGADAFSIASGGDPGTIAPDTMRTVIVAFAPTSAGTKSASLVIDSNAGQQTVALSGEAVAAETLPRAQATSATDVTPYRATLHGSVSPNGSATTAAFTYFPTSRPDSAVTVAAAPSPLDGDDAQDVRAKLSDLTPGTSYSYRLVATNEAGSDTSAVQSFTTTAPSLRVEPASLSLQATVGASTTDTVTLSNAGDADLQIDRIALGGDGAEAFNIASGGDPGTIAPDTTRAVIVAFAPTSAGTKSASLVIDSNAGQQTVALSGEAVAAETLPRAQATSATDVTPYRATLHGSVSPNGSATTAAFTYFPTSRPDSAVTVAAAPSPLDGDDAQDVRAKLSDLTPGTPYSYRLVATNEAGSDTSAVQSFTTTAPSLRVEPASLSLQATVGASTTDTVTLSNAGDADLQIDRIALGGDGAEAFNIASGGDPGTIAPDTTRAVIVAFAPTSTGTKSASLVIDSNAGQQTVALSGATRAPSLRVAPTALDFGSMPLDSAPTDTVTLSNTGDADLQIDRIALGGDGADAFSIASGGDPGTIAPDTMRAVIVAFAPASAGTKSASLVIDSNAGRQTVALSGEAVNVTVRTPNDPKAHTDLDLTISLSSTDFKPTSRTLFYRSTGQTGKESFQSIPLQRDGSDFITTIPAEDVTLRGVEYYTQFSDDRQTLTFPAGAPKTSLIRVQVGVDQQLSPLRSHARTYQMISVPAVLADSSVRAVLEDDYGRSGPNRWRLLRWDSKTNQYNEFPDLDETFVPGQAFWLITRDDGSFDIGNSRSVDASGPRRLTLQPGWNQIGNPFAFPVAWSDVEHSTSVERPLYFDGTAYQKESVQVLTPWAGYFVYNGGAETTISVPPVEASTDSASTVSAAKAAAAGGYELHLNAQHGRLYDARTAVGLASGARSGRDPMDAAEPPGIGDHVRLSVMEGTERLDRSFKPTSQDESGQWWNLEVSLIQDGKTPSQPQPVTVTLATEQGQLPAEYKRYIFDRDAGQRLPLNDRSVTVQVGIDQPVRHLRLVLGTPDFAKDHSEGAPLKPTHFALMGNAPNPFTERGTTIRYQLSHRGHALLEVYNMLGQHIATLVDAKQAAGVHAVTWAPDEQASGIYIYRLRAGGMSTAQKMVLLR